MGDWIVEENFMTFQEVWDVHFMPPVCMNEWVCAILDMFRVPPTQPYIAAIGRNTQPEDYVLMDVAFYEGMPVLGSRRRRMCVSVQHSAT